MTKTRSQFKVVQIDPDRVFLIDLNLGGMSVTNDAENVYAAMQEQYPRRRVIYRDSNGIWDEIVLNGKGTANFLPYNEHLPQGEYE